MAAASRDVIVSADQGGVCTVTINYDDVTFLLTGLKIVNTATRACTVHARHPTTPIVDQTFSITAGLNQVFSLSILGIILDPDLCLPTGWEVGIAW